MLKKQQAEEKAKKAKKTREEIKLYCYEEKKEVDRLKKQINILEKIRTNIECLSSAISITNKILQSAQNDTQITKPESEIDIELKKYQNELYIAEQKYKSKRLEFSKKR